VRRANSSIGTAVHVSVGTAVPLRLDKAVVIADT